MKILWNFTLKQRVKHKLCKIWLCLQFSWDNHLLYEKSIRSFMIECLYDNLLICHFCLPAFQIISESWRKQHFKLFWQASRGNHTCVSVHIHTNTKSTIDESRVALQVWWLWRKIRFTYQFTVHHLPPVIEVWGWTLHGLLIILTKKEIRNDVNLFPLTGETQMETMFGPHCLLPGHPWSH